MHSSKTGIDTQQIIELLTLWSSELGFDRLSITGIDLTDNAEGLIIRNDSIVYKIKKEETADFLITGYTLGSNANQIRSVSLGVFSSRIGPPYNGLKS